MRSQSSSTRWFLLLALVAVGLLSATLALGIRPSSDQPTGTNGSVTREIPPPAQLPAVPPPIRTDLPLLVPTPDPTPAPTRRPRASRIVVRSLGIDLPIISRDRKVPNQGPDQYPPCDVALYHTAFAQPGEPGTTYLYGHAREGMFLPLLEASMRDDGQEMLGKVVRVYTNDDRMHLYRITRVKRHATDFSLVTDVPPEKEQLILQTSEGPRGTVPKLQVLAEPFAVREVSSEEARPEARPRACYDTP
jgi:hypothetical protein